MTVQTAAEVVVPRSHPAVARLELFDSTADRLLPHGNVLQLALTMTVFVACFAVSGSLAAMMPSVGARLQLSETQVGIALAVPALAGSLLRLPFGILVDRLRERTMLIAI